MAAEGRIVGTVIDTATGTPLPGATLLLEGTNRGTVSDSTGAFILDDVPCGECQIVISLVGHETVIRELTVENDKDTSIKIRLKQTPLEMPGVVVTGTRTPRFVKDVPVFTEVITSEAIEDKAAANLYEALEGTPGIRVEQQCQACNFSVLRMQGLGADHTQLLLDGQPLYSGLAGVYGLQQFSTAEIDRIEVVKGAGSALYGSNAIAGAINIISSIPRKTECQVGIELGEYNTNNYNIKAGAKKGDVSLFVFGQQNTGDAIDETGDGYTRDEVYEGDGISDRVRTNARNGGFNLFLENLTGLDRLTFRGRILSERRQGGEMTDDLYENPFSAGTEDINTDRYSLETEYWRQFSSGFEVNASVSLAHHKRTATNDTYLGDYEATHQDTVTADSIVSLSAPIEELRPYLADEDIYTGSFNTVYPAGRHRFLAGTQYTHNKLEESGKYIASTDPENEDFGVSYTSFSNKEADDFGIFIQDEITLTKKLEIVAGLRFDYHNSEDNFRGSGDIYSEGVKPVEFTESTVNPRFALKYTAATDLTVRASIGTGFRVPYGFSEDLHLCSGSPRVYKGSDLEPEKSLSYNFSADYTKTRGNASLNLYRTELKNKIDFSEAEPDIAAIGYDYQWKNIDDAYVMGVELSGQYALSADLSLSGNFTVAEGEYDNVRADWVGTRYEDISRKISRLPETAGGFKIEYSPRNWNFVLNGEYKGKMYIDLTEPADAADVKIKTTESFILLNAKISYKLYGQYKLHVGVKNLSDYIQEEKHIDDAAFMYAPVYGRMFYGGITFSL